MKGQRIRQEYQNAYHEIGGMIEVLDEAGIEIEPVMYAEATPGGTICAEAYDHLLLEMMEGLEKGIAMDACLVVPHGAAVSEHFADMDSHWLSVLRNKVGEAHLYWHHRPSCQCKSVNGFIDS